MLFAIFPAWFVLEITKPHSCTIFTAVQGETVLFGDNFDYHEGDLIIGYFPPSAEGYGSIHFGYLESKGSTSYTSYQRAVVILTVLGLVGGGVVWIVKKLKRTKRKL